MGKCVYDGHGVDNVYGHAGPEHARGGREQGGIGNCGGQGEHEDAERHIEFEYTWCDLSGDNSTVSHER